MFSQSPQRGTTIEVQKVPTHLKVLCRLLPLAGEISLQLSGQLLQGLLLQALKLPR